MREGTDNTAGIAIGACGRLTLREAEAVLWIALGKTSWEAGRILGITEGTVNVHVANASAKLGASNRAHLVACAFVRGILVGRSVRDIPQKLPKNT
jgi:DNA-binding CsgD family transcriptional regulator